MNYFPRKETTVKAYKLYIGSPVYQEVYNYAKKKVKKIVKTMQNSLPYLAGYGKIIKLKIHTRSLCTIRVRKIFSMRT